MYNVVECSAIYHRNEFSLFIKLLVICDTKCAVTFAFDKKKIFILITEKFMYAMHTMHVYFYKILDCRP